MVKESATVLEPGTGEIVEKKSRFIGYVRHVESEEEADAFITEIKKKHYDARHNCYAYVVGAEQSVVRFSDDGEPGGTAGKPILEVLLGEGLSDVCIVVTRYFGGTLLGTGGLVRAYTDAAKAGIAGTEIVRRQKVIPLRITVDYTDLGKIQHILAAAEIPVTDSDYGEKVTLSAEVCVDDMERVEKELTEATAARALLEKGEPVFAFCTGGRKQ